jgi:hypothetical protein
MTATPPLRYRESTYESAETAEDIFDLYGAPPRDSWASGSGVGVALGDPDADGHVPFPAPAQRVSYSHGPQIPSSPASSARNGHRLSQIPSRNAGQEGAEMEELDDEANTPMTVQSWDGPMATLSKRASGISIDSANDSGRDFGRMRDEGQGLGIGGLPSSGRRGSSGSGSNQINLNDNHNINGQEYIDYPTASSSSTTTSRSNRKPLPTVTITPDMTPSKRHPPASVGGTGEDSRRVSTLSTSTSDSPIINRLTPRLSGYGDGNTSQASFGSSQYPGEDPDAYHVRSTCKSFLTDVADPQMQG